MQIVDVYLRAVSLSSSKIGTLENCVSRAVVTIFGHRDKSSLV